MQSVQAGEVDYVSGKTRLYGIVGHPIEQVKSPASLTAEFRRRGQDALLVPMHVLPAEFEACMPSLLRLQNLDGLIFTVPFKLRACAFADAIGDQAQVVGAINALARGADGRWRGDMFDGLGCVEAFRRRGIGFGGKRVMLLGAGGAGSAIAVAIGFEQPRSLRIFDLDPDRAAALVARIARAHPGLDARAGPPGIGQPFHDILINATPTGMRGDARLPLPLDTLPRDLVVQDVVTLPERTPLLALAERCGCVAIAGREMMHGQISRLADFFLGA